MFLFRWRRKQDLPPVPAGSRVMYRYQVTRNYFVEERNIVRPPAAVGIRSTWVEVGSSWFLRPRTTYRQSKAYEVKPVVLNEKDWKNSEAAGFFLDNSTNDKMRIRSVGPIGPMHFHRVRKGQDENSTVHMYHMLWCLLSTKVIASNTNGLTSVPVRFT